MNKKYCLAFYLLTLGGISVAFAEVSPSPRPSVSESMEGRIAPGTGTATGVDLKGRTRPNRKDFVNKPFPRNVNSGKTRPPSP